MNHASSSPLSQPDPGYRVLTTKASAKHRQPSSNLRRPASRPRLRKIAKTTPQLQRNSEDRQEESISLIDNTQPNRIPNLFVQVSQHSSLDQDQYLLYLSSISTRSYLSSAPPHEDSGLGESSSEPEDLELSKSEYEVVVPDSQSLPGSSSYQPTASTFESFSNLGERRVQQYQSYYSPHPSINSSDPSNSFEARYSDPAEDSSGIYVAESPESKISSQISASVSRQDFVQSSSSSTRRGNPLARFTALANHNRSSSKSETARSSLSLKSQEEILDSQIPVSTGSGSQVCVSFEICHLPVPVYEPYNMHHPRLRHGTSFDLCSVMDHSTDMI